MLYSVELCIENLLFVLISYDSYLTQLSKLGQMVALQQDSTFVLDWIIFYFCFAVQRVILDCRQMSGPVEEPLTWFDFTTQ